MNQKQMQLLTLKPLEAEFLWHLFHGSTVKEAAKTLAIKKTVADYILRNLRRRFFARTNVQLAFLVALCFKQQTQLIANALASGPGDNGGDSQPTNITKLCSK